MGKELHGEQKVGGNCEINCKLKRKKVRVSGGREMGGKGSEGG